MLCHRAGPRILRNGRSTLKSTPGLPLVKDLNTSNPKPGPHGGSSNVSCSRICRCLMSSAALLLPTLAATESHLQTEAVGTALRATAHVNFKIIIPSMLSLDVASGSDLTPGAHTVAIFSNSRNVTLAASGHPSDNARGNLILSAAARRIISQHAACTLGLTRPAGDADTGRVVCTVSMP